MGDRGRRINASFDTIEYSGSVGINQVVVPGRPGGEVHSPTALRALHDHVQSQAR